MVKILLVLDANYLLYRAVFILQKLKTLYGDLETLLLNDYNNITNAYPFHMIHVVSDSKTNWRKIIYPEYKGKRKKDADIDWEFVFDTFDTFKEKIKGRHNCLLHQIEMFEGDDIIAHIVKESNKQGYSNLILSNDGDLHQLLKYSTAENYINIMYNHKFQDEKLFVPKNYSIFLKHINDNTTDDLFDMNDDTDFINYFDKITSKAKISQIIPEESYFKKLVAGDTGDNVMSIIKTEKDSRGIGDTGSSKVYEMFKQKYSKDINFDSDEFITELCDIISIYKKTKDEDFLKKVKENIKFSRTLTRLDSKYLPAGYHQILYNNIKI